jgi:hypothetical protein
LEVTTMKANRPVGMVFAAAAIAIAFAVALPGATSAQERAPLLAGKVVSSTGEALAGIPVKAHRTNSSVSVAVYTDAKGEYSFPIWSDLLPGSYTVGIELPDFEHTGRQVAVPQGQTLKVDFTLKSRPLAYEDATASEIVNALPGTDQQKVLFAQCGNCHTLQWTLRVPHTKEEWAAIIRRMAGRAAEDHTPGTYAFSQKQFIEPLAEYLAMIRGPGSSDTIPFKQRPRPTDTASTNIVVTEYTLPRGGTRELYLIRGDRRFVWPHDVIVNDRYAYYTDHFSYVLGRVDRQTGETVELPFELPKGAGRGGRGEADGRPGEPGGGAHELQFDRQGNVIIGMDNGTVKYDPKAGRFTTWPIGRPMFGLDANDNLWHQSRRGGELIKFDTRDPNAKSTTYIIPKNRGIYDTDTDSKGRTHIYIWREGKIGIWRPSNTPNTTRRRRWPGRGAGRSMAGTVSGPPSFTPARS